jgi:predicted aldo/keto reductase-like oxidoreductase
MASERKDGEMSERERDSSTATRDPNDGPLSDRSLTRREVLTLSGAAGASLILGGYPQAAAARKQDKRKKAASAPQVPRRVLGKTGETVPILLMGGSMAFDQVFDPKLAEAYRYGVNYVDTADCYAGGTSETAVGAFHSRAKLRKRLWITSKSDEHDPAGFKRVFERSLQRMKTSYIDLYFLHMLQDSRYLNKEMMRTAEQLKKRGKLRFFGFSCHDGNVAELLQLAAKTPWVDAVMFRYNFRKYGDRELNKAIDACVKAKVGLIAMKTQSSAASFKEKWVPFKQTGTWNKYQAVLKSVWADERISAAVSAMDTLEKLRENIRAALNKSKLTALEQHELERYAAATRSMACDGCDHLCGGCLNAPVRIGDTMRYLMYHDVYGQQEEARRLFTALPAAAQQLEGVDFGPASAACPHGVDIGWHMRRAATVLGRPT